MLRVPVACPSHSHRMWLACGPWARADQSNCTENIKCTVSATARHCGSETQVPNETLMKSDIDNITESDALMDRIHFEVDAKGVTPAAIQELGHRVHEMMKDAAVAHLYDHHYHPHASIRAIGNPLKFQVRPVRRACVSGTATIFACVRAVCEHVHCARAPLHTDPLVDWNARSRRCSMEEHVMCSTAICSTSGRVCVRVHQ